MNKIIFGFSPYLSLPIFRSQQAFSGRFHQPLSDRTQSVDTFSLKFGTKKTKTTETDYKRVEEILQDFDPSTEAFHPFWQRQRDTDSTLPKSKLASNILAVIRRNGNSKDKKTYDGIQSFLDNSTSNFKTYWQQLEKRNKGIAGYSDACVRKGYMEYLNGSSESSGLTHEQYVKTEKLIREFGTKKTFQTFWEEQVKLDPTLPSYKSAFDIRAVMQYDENLKDKNTYEAIQKFLDLKKPASNFSDYWKSIETESNVVSRPSASARKKYMEYLNSKTFSKKQHEDTFIAEYETAKLHFTIRDTSPGRQGETPLSDWEEKYKTNDTLSRPRLLLDKEAYKVYMQHYLRDHPQDTNPDFPTYQEIQLAFAKNRNKNRY